MPELALEVIVQLGGEDVTVGRLWAHRGRNTESATFAYDDAYLMRSDGYELDPTLPLATGQQQTPVGRSITCSEYATTCARAHFASAAPAPLSTWPTRSRAFPPA